MGMSVFQEVVECWEFLKLVFAEVWNSIITILCPFNLKATKPECTDYISDFSVSKYMDRLEKAGIEIMAEAEKRPEYQLVLWAGLDGLRMNEDGTTEWIRREEEKPKPISVSYFPVNRIEPVSPFIQSHFCNVSCETQNRIEQLQAQMQDLQLQQWQQQQMQNMINAIQPAYCPSYIQAMNPQWQSPYLQSALTQCCVKHQ